MSGGNRIALRPLEEGVGSGVVFKKKVLTVKDSRKGSLAKCPVLEGVCKFSGRHWRAWDVLFAAPLIKMRNRQGSWAARETSNQLPSSVRSHSIHSST